MEMRAMWQATAVPWLRQAGLAEGVFLSRRLHVWGIGESLLAERVAEEQLSGGGDPSGWGGESRPAPGG
jgi:nicotinamide-nucleotide amidase